MPGSFGKSVLECGDELGRRLPALIRRYRRMVVVGAMAEHLGQALRTLLRRQICDASAVRRLLGRVESRALRRQPGLDVPSQDSAAGAPGHAARQ
jgi:hypothetical protein